MNRSRLHLIWFLHQPFFIPDDEILWRIDSTYLPLLDALSDRSIKFSLGITASLLERCAVLRPDFIETLMRAVHDDKIMLLGTTAYHPILPWLSSKSARAQIIIDREIKGRLGLPVAKVFWPTELAWSMRVGSLAVEFGYEAVVVDSGSRDAANMLPRWQSGPHGLRPIIEIDQPLGTSSKVETRIGSGVSQSPLTLWVRERSLSNALLDVMHSDEEDEQRHFTTFSTALELARSRAFNSEEPLIFADDAERSLPNGLARLLGLLDSAINASVEFVSPQGFSSWPCENHLSYIPAGTMEGSDAMWSTTADDLWFRRHLDHLTDRVEARFDLMRPSTKMEQAIRDKLLRVQDSGFYFWHYVSRARRNFCAGLLEIEDWLDGKSDEP